MIPCLPLGDTPNRPVPWSEPSRSTEAARGGWRGGGGGWPGQQPRLCTQHPRDSQDNLAHRQRTDSSPSRAAETHPDLLGVGAGQVDHKESLAHPLSFTSLAW